MFLKDLITWLESQDQNLKVPYGFAEPSSYRGYYEDLAFAPEENVTFGEMLAYAKYALGKTFEGYKGGQYLMDEYTNCWIAEYGDSHNADYIGPTLLKYWELIAY